MVLALSLSGCAGLGRRLLEPEVRVIGVDVGDMALDSAELVFDFEVDNPNAVALVLNQIGYQLHINGRPFADGRRNERTQIAANGESRVQLPLVLRYADVARVIRSLGDNRRPDYELEADFQFDAPVLGAVTVPVRRRGRVPLDRIRLPW